ncbi:hypothetical protein J0A67_09490 [Algoriphagus aestuariicola]|jgi:hypothetical protein|uniref:Uncharacterized protein n=1 Tax=Algoriphagus aestuariicola TaxID=1852016 RepID=A0ABS3BPV0_9BACT|nr:hypothetical protein [Algoriphagus aestuariicola]MBN7801095.1 hypothetical protein [Algoriphagus aestuariicola]
MNQLPKLKDFQVPAGYFDQLPERIIAKEKTRKFPSLIKYAAAAIVVLGLGVSWQSGMFTPESPALSIDEEAQLYIESQVWSSEDVLSLADDPNAILDQIIEEEMPSSDEQLWIEDELNWF